jgi:hypothetical protein
MLSNAQTEKRRTDRWKDGRLDDLMTSWKLYRHSDSQTDIHTKRKRQTYKQKRKIDEQKNKAKHSLKDSIGLNYFCGMILKEFLVPIL